VLRLTKLRLFSVKLVDVFLGMTANIGAIFHTIKTSVCEDSIQSCILSNSIEAGV